MALTNEDREALAVMCGWPGVCHNPLNELVEQIVERHVAEARAAALNEAAVAIEQTKPRNPINGDGSNYALSRALQAVARLAGDDADAITSAAKAERKRLDAEYEADCARLLRMHSPPP